MAVGPLILVSGVVGTLAQPDDFDVIRDPTSDLGADTANAAWLANIVGSVVPGVLLLAFAWGLWTCLARSRSGRVGTFLVGAIGVGLIVTGLATLDCRTMDSGCTNDSTEAAVHLITAGLLGLGVLISPFVVARALKHVPLWESLRRPTLVLGFLTIAGAVGGSVVGAGLGAYAGFAPWFTWIFVLALRMNTHAESNSPTRSALPSADL